ncbi:hypothetical protein [Streptomyces sp. NBC_01465]|uniref:hypothetical protein n=1 Tax=Streptomyces sp. NBC_01465 TaxID=2903878 RepID=UPI002E33DE79|nr:hypothetical protein [Streptomyces sp. NBC_01465]
MTSTADTTQHPEVSEISDLTEGLLPPSRTADVRRHLDECTLCAEVRVSLDEIRSLLGTLPGPQRMPDDVAGRIDAALAAEALLNASAPAEATHVSRETAPASQPTDAPVADRPAGRSSAATGPGRSHPARRRRRNAVLGAAFGAAVIGAGVFLLQQSAVNPSASDSSASAKKADDSFAAAGLEQKVHSLLVPGSGSSSGSDRSPNEKPATPSLGVQSNSPKDLAIVNVPQCIQAGIGRDNALASEQGTYNGAKAYLVVLPHPTDPSLVQAYVVDATCVDAHTPAKGKVLLTRSYARR